jgi:hypothetical protein
VSARRRQGRDNSVFDDNNNGSSYAPEATDAAIFGSIEAVDAGRQVAKPVSIFEIYPDPVQPRRAVPSILREVWNGTPESVADMLAGWYELAAQERTGSDLEFDIRPYLEAGDEVRRPDVVKPMEAAFLDLVELAASIRLNGLTNPITVARTPQGYRLETGERRWLAFHLLYQYTNDSKYWEKIPARVVDVPDVWRQASENGARSNLTAIGKARQLAILIMEIHRQKGAQFLAFDEIVQDGKGDRAFYAQVADGTKYPVTGYGETILNAVGFKQPSQMREHRLLLGYPDEVWQLADDLNWPYGRIADLKRKSLYDDKRFIQLAIKKANNQGYMHVIPNDDSPALPQSKREEPVNPLVANEYKRIFTALWAMARQVGEGDVRTKRSDLDNIKYMRKWLEDLEKVVRDNLVK